MNIKNVLLLLLIFAGITSCVSRKDMVYFYENEASAAKPYVYELMQPERSQLRIKANDQLTISVSAAEQEAAIPFNLPVVGVGNVLEGGLRPTGTPQLQTYLVSNEGAISFPVLGEIDVAGLTRRELAQKLEEAIGVYVKKPIVNVRVVNFQISVLGEVAKPGTFSISDEYISLPKALGLAGDMTIYGRRENVLVMREEDGRLIKAYLDLTDNEVINSPYFYLKQNDVVVVEPNRPALQAANYNRNASLYVSVASVLISLIVVISR
ncbi:polysaccharide biosynthesis/export family protein [Leeuwenhoekiella parthenopeia]|uniref:Polysaccharide biosynthesis/export family protein n=1 Tax=Leeuwenhoekiella parthenopeia TaxID=2890320 RepID=A0ABS8GWR6_9FLAO|nr:polysaccharide biosynthesis/export family protein [Leeuwenhoekiella parthenopeia]MCC4214241.1 polysaccharide biosynthesis/export family protein [Leeuwenhoekiella parthenopeia]